MDLSIRDGENELQYIWRTSEYVRDGNKYKTFNFSELNSELNFEWDSRTYKNAN